MPNVDRILSVNLAILLYLKHSLFEIVFVTSNESLRPAPHQLLKETAKQFNRGIFVLLATYGIAENDIFVKLVDPCEESELVFSI